MQKVKILNTTPMPILKWKSFNRFCPKPLLDLVYTFGYLVNECLLLYLLFEFNNQCMATWRLSKK